MCFSATASFAVSAGLIPVGVYCVYKVRLVDRTYWPFAIYPLIFGIQQAAEGWLWLVLDTGNVESIRFPAISFVFFSHFFWLFWIPYSCYVVEISNSKKRFFLITTVMGCLFGLAMFIPVMLYTDWMTVSIIHQSISYELKLLFDDFVSRLVVRGAYVLMILIPLLLSSHRYLRYFGVIIALSVLGTVLLYTETFISVWCFFAAVFSFYMLYMIISLDKQKAIH